jgi:hypothetical protein
MEVLEGLFSGENKVVKPKSGTTEHDIPKDSS